jgi:hypothetical protein
MPSSAAVPAALLSYAGAGGSLDEELRARASAASGAVAAFRSTAPDYGARTPDAAAPVVAYARTAAEVDAWVGRVGTAFRMADAGGWFGLLLALFRPAPTTAVTVEDRQLAGAGWPTSAEAAAAGTALADELRPHLSGTASAGDLERWSPRIADHTDDEAFTAAFFQRLGVRATLRLPLLVERSYPLDDYGHPEWGLGVLAPFSEALATALRRLPPAFAHGLTDYRPGYGSEDPEAYHQSLLFVAGDFPTAFLVRLADHTVSETMWLGNRRATPLHLTPFGPVVDPVANILGAVSRNQEASARWLDETFPTGPSNLDLLLQRYGNDLDGDGGRAAAEVLRQALTIADPARAARLFEATMRGVDDSGIRNQLMRPVLVDATVRNLPLLADVAATEGGDAEARLRTTHDFLSRLLGADEDARRIYDAALREVYDTVGGARPGDGLGSESWRIGSLLGLLLTADANADIAGTKERIARRQALLDGIQQISDLGLTFVPGGKWMPFATAGRDRLLDSFRLGGELDQALERRDDFEAQLRFQLSAVFAVRLAAEGTLPLPPSVPAVPFDRMSPAQQGAFRDWVNSDRVRDAIGDIRTQAGQRMDEVERVLPDAG